MNIIFDLDHFLERLSDRIGRSRTATVNRGYETDQLQSIPHTELVARAEEHRMNVVKRVGGEIYTFTRKGK